MSLSVYLTLSGVKKDHHGSGIFVRAKGQVKEISRAEWDNKFPDREPVIANALEDGEEVFDWTITHSLGTMAGVAGIYKHLWQPDELGITKASELIEPLRKGLALLKSDPGHFKVFNPKNDWGDYEGLVHFVEKYQAACVRYPGADIEVSR